MIWSTRYNLVLEAKAVHRNQLWKYSGRNPPAWYNQASGVEQRHTLSNDGSDPAEVGA